MEGLHKPLRTQAHPSFTPSRRRGSDSRDWRAWVCRSAQREREPWSTPPYPGLGGWALCGEPEIAQCCPGLGRYNRGQYWEALFSDDSSSVGLRGPSSPAVSSAPRVGQGCCLLSPTPAFYLCFRFSNSSFLLITSIETKERKRERERNSPNK